MTNPTLARLELCWWCQKKTKFVECVCPECQDEPENNRGDMCAECEVEQ